MMIRPYLLSLPTLFLLSGLPILSLAEGIVEEEQAAQHQGMGAEPLPLELYRLPVTPEPSPQQKALSCLDLEREIAHLEPQTYSYQPGFYDDPYQGVAMTLGTAISPGVYLFSGYIKYLDYKGQGRVITAEEKISLLRHLKAEQHCFES